MLRIVDTKCGKIEGLPAADPRITSFKGIPFAKPPVGNLRFHAPVPVEKWEGTLQAYKFGPIAVQPTPCYDPNDLYCREWSVDKDIPMSEDCLYLNVWTPANKADEKLPVYVWIYGGGFQTGFTAEMEFDGERIARRGIVVVTLCYRLNMFGFMCHPEITAENSEGPANFGLLDQRMAMQWVKDNIEAFGGDSNNITIGGQSAGGGSVLNQMMYGTRGLFNKAGCHSGMFKMPGNNIMIPKPLSEAEKDGLEFFNFCGAKSLADMRKFTTAELRQKWSDFGGFGKSIATWLPVNDGKFVTDYFFNAVENGKVENIPFICGYTTDEFCFDGHNAVKDGVEEYLRLLEKTGAKVKPYTYQFDISIPGWDNPGKFHSVDLWFWFETLAKCWRPFTGKWYDASRKMCNYLCNFIKTGDPNGKDCDGSEMEKWEGSSAKEPRFIKFVE